MSVKIKVCGITSERDALEAVYLGVDAIGFDFRSGSGASVTIRQAAGIAAKLPPFVARVGVFSDQPAQVVVETADAVRLNAVQLSGREPAAACARLPLGWYKAFRITSRFAVSELASYPCTAYLLDFRGAAGRAEPARPAWELARAASRYGRVILACGVDGPALSEAVAAARPYAVDVSDEIDVRPGIKDIDRLEAIVTALRREDARGERSL